MKNVLENWTTTTDELLSNIIDYTSEEITCLLSSMGLIGIRDKGQIEDLEKYIFLHGNDQEIYSSDERLFIEGVGSVYLYNDVNRRTNKGIVSTKIIAVDLSRFVDAVKSCFFFMKVVNKATDGFNIFFCKTSEGLFVGCRLYDKDEFKNCTLSVPITTNLELENLSQRLMYLPDTDEFISYYSAVVEAIEYKESIIRDYDLEIMLKRGVNFSYLDMLSEIEKNYDINLDYAKEMYYKSFELNQCNDIVYDYSSVMDSLRFIKSQKMNTLEMLFEAEEMALLANETEQQNKQILQLTNESNDSDTSKENMLKEHLDNPELMIKILKAQRGL
ncbi:hypothetical protein [Anaerobium acetethylicum]|nr:hypothetical protein [Anaerobium acetethylicum]